jgi:hypothetical protein
MIEIFRISPSPTTVTLEAICHPCKTIAEITLTFNELRNLGHGRSVATLVTATPPEHVM